jgi:saccharopine dehydrogenase-like protein
MPTANRPITFGVVGGYGSTGSAVVPALLNSGDGNVLVGGRDPRKAEQAAAKLGSRALAAQVDAFDDRSLDEFCSRCSIVINCAGPVMLLQDRVAQAAFRNRSHYVDVADLAFVKGRMLPHAQQAVDLGLSFVISAGWNPGITELVPAYAYALAQSRMQSIESLKVYFSDSGEWSDNALRDGVWYLRKAGLRTPTYFHKGERCRARLSLASRKVDLGEPIGRRRFSLVSLPEQDEMGRQFADCDVFTYSYVSGFRTIAAAIAIALLPLPDGLGVRLVRNMFRRNRLPVDGFVTGRVLGLSGGRSWALNATVVYRERRDYWMNGAVPAMVSRMISQGTAIRPGVHYLWEAVEPIAFMEALKQVGVEQSESFAPCQTGSN